MTNIVDTSQTVTPGYFQQKVEDFQNLLFDLDTGAAALQSIYDWDDNLNPEFNQAMAAHLDEYAERKSDFKMAAESLNMAIGGYNAMGGELPEIRIPSGLGIPPLVLGAGALVALGVVAGLTSFGINWLKTSSEITRLNINLDAIKDPTQKANVAAAQLQIEASAKAAETGTMSQVAGIIKWVAIAAVAYLVLNKYQR